MLSVEIQNYNDVVVFDEGRVQRTEQRSFTAGSCSDVWKGEVDGFPVAIKVYRGLPYVEGVREQFWNVSASLQLLLSG